MSETLDQPREGVRSFGDLQVSWHGQPTPAGWDVQCALQLGSASSRQFLNLEAAHLPFELDDDSRIAWGYIDLRSENNGSSLALILDCHQGPAFEQAVPLCTWKACDPCGQIPPQQGSKKLGEGEWIKVEWTIGGSEQACLAVQLKIWLFDEITGINVDLNPLNPVWRDTLHREENRLDLTFILSVADNGTARIDAVLRHAGLPGQSIELDHFPLAPDVSPSVSVPSPTAGTGVAFGRPREFASFTYPCALQAPTATQQSSRFVDIENTSEFQQTLRTLATQKDRKTMVAEAEDFIAPTSTKYPDQYVRRIADLAAPMNRLEGPQVQALLSMQATSNISVQAALVALLGQPIETFLTQADYAQQLNRLQNSLLARLIASVPGRYPDDALVQALQVCHLAGILGDATPPPATAVELQDCLEASILLPATILPLPPAQASAAQISATPAYVAPLGFAAIQVIKQRLVRYRLGEIAHIENVMCGESKERSEEHSRRVDIREREAGENSDTETQELDYQGHAHGAQESLSNPLNTLKREFDNLKQEYGSDGLSVTVSGSWTDTPSGPPTLEQNAATHARRLLDRASARVARRTESERNRRSVEEFIERNRRRFDNEKGNAPLIGIYRWIDEIHAAHLEHRGNRLILEIVVADPAADYVARNNALHGLDITAPPPPWQGSGNIAPIHSPADINRDNYAALAATYNAAAVPPPPPQTLSLSAALSNDTPRAEVSLAIPAGYLASSGSVSYGWAGTTATGSTQTLEVLVGEQALKIDPSQDPNPGSKTLSAMPPGSGPVPVSVIAVGLEYALNITLSCTCSTSADLYLRWQMAAYNGVMAAYQARREEYFRAMTLLADGPARSTPERCRETEREALQKSAIEALMAPFQMLPATAAAFAAGQGDGVALRLIPLFHDALDWGEMTYAFQGRYYASNDPDRPTWQKLVQTSGGAPGFHEFLEAGAARMLVPVKPSYVLPLLFYLGSAGQFWRGAEKLTPVFEADSLLANELKSLAHASPQHISGESWEVEVATSMLMLQADANLPDQSELGEPTP